MARAASKGAIAAIALGAVETVSNLFFEAPFEDEEDVGLAYAFQAQRPVADWVGVGFEAFGDVESVFEDEREDAHFIGPAIFTEFDLGRGRILEPRPAALFRVTEDTPDATLSTNFELKF